MLDAVQRFAEFSRLMSAEKGLQATLDLAVAIALETTPGCEHASTRPPPGRASRPSPTSS
ncbi:hypothetical protein [Aeromicrobium sp. Leaf350]|uniref:hypothetical protein n=1 Tax=Aeromicrobium sp. Leaf350 TaxID=2876565 RepID=UPI001E5C8C6B|nr:hypothetical protein [Aeromicrobium sp. Leaf350]